MSSAASRVIEYRTGKAPLASPSIFDQYSSHAGQFLEAFLLMHDQSAWTVPSDIDMNDDGLLPISMYVQIARIYRVHLLDGARPLLSGIPPGGLYHQYIGCKGCEDHHSSCFATLPFVAGHLPGSHEFFPRHDRLAILRAMRALVPDQIRAFRLFGEVRAGGTFIRAPRRIVLTQRAIARDGHHSGGKDASGDLPPPSLSPGHDSRALTMPDAQDLASRQIEHIKFHGRFQTLPTHLETQPRSLLAAPRNPVEPKIRARARNPGYQRAGFLMFVPRIGSSNYDRRSVPPGANSAASWPVPSPAFSVPDHLSSSSRAIRTPRISPRHQASGKTPPPLRPPHAPTVRCFQAENNGHTIRSAI